MSILVICGVMIGYICSAITDNWRGGLCPGFQHRQPAQLVYGSFSGMTWGNVGTAAAITLPCLAAAFYCPAHGRLPDGESAASVGVSVRSFSVLLVLLSSLLAACVTAFAGPISFVGIAVPHLVKTGVRQRRPLHSAGLRLGGHCSACCA